MGALLLDKPKMTLLYGMEREGRKWNKDDKEAYGRAKNWQREVQTQNKYVQVVSTMKNKEEIKLSEKIDNWNLCMPWNWLVRECRNLADGHLKKFKKNWN